MEVAAVGTFLSVGIKLPYFAFFFKPDYTKEIKPIPGNMYVAMGMASFLCFIIGVVPNLLYQLLPFPVEYVPYTPWHVLQTLLLLSFTGLAFYLMRHVIEPKAKINLDFDYIYRLGGKLGMGFAKWPLEKLDNWWTEFYNRVGLVGMLVFAKVSRLFDEKAIDGVVDGTAYGVLGAGGRLAKFQTGKLSDYIGLALVIGVGVFAIFYLF
jgi:multicomponent Na+:H+ antiporter subunit D